jgi:6-phosphofructokinase 1
MIAEPYVTEDAKDPVSSFALAGPRKHLAFDPARARAAIVSAGGLCPGTNNVIRSLVLSLFHGYGVRDIVGYRYGFEGLTDKGERIALTPEVVRHAHRLGGTLLGTSRMRVSATTLVDGLVRDRIDILFAIGGNGTLRAARDAIAEIARRGLRIVVVAVPKTIDDDVGYVDKTFGFDTAVEHARDAIDAAHAEALAVRNGIGVVKLMGRDAGFVAAHATLASGEANLCLLPEFGFSLAGLLAALEVRLRERGHAVVVVAEGCAKRLVTADSERDPSGNPRYASASLDIGPRLCHAIQAHFTARDIPFSLKYIDPSYMIRAAPANASDAFYCGALGRHAVHAAMAGLTGVLAGRCRGVYVYVPIAAACDQVPRVDATLWQAVREATGQPDLG